LVFNPGKTEKNLFTKYCFFVLSLTIIQFRW